MTEARFAGEGDDTLAADGAASAAAAKTPARSWYALAILTVTFMIAQTDRLALSILMEPIKREMHLSDKQLGLLAGLAFAAFYMTLGIPLARLADRSSRVKLISACLGLWSVMVALTGMARNFPQLFLARMGVGIGEAGCIPSSHSLISDLFTPRRRTLAMSIFQTGSVAGQAGGLFVIGLLAQHFGWRLSLQLVGLAGLPLALLAVLTMREPPRPKTKAQTKESAWSAISALARRRTFVNLALGYGLSTFCTSGLQQWTPTFLIRSFGLNMAQVGAWAGASVALGGILGTLSGGVVATWLVTRRPRWEPWIPAAAYALAWPCYTLLYLSPTVWMALAMKAIAGYFAAGGAAVAWSAVQSLTEPHRRATAASIVLFISSLLGMGLGPYLIGYVSDVLTARIGPEGLRYALALTCGLLAWATLHYALSARRQPSDTAR